MTDEERARKFVDDFVAAWLRSEQPVGTTQARLASGIARLLAEVRAEEREVWIEAIEAETWGDGRTAVRMDIGRRILDRARGTA